MKERKSDVRGAEKGDAEFGKAENHSRTPCKFVKARNDVTCGKTLCWFSYTDGTG